MRQTLNPRFMELTDCYRLTKRQCKLAFSLTPELRLAKGLRTRYDPEAGVELWLADSGEDEVGWVWGEALARARPGQPSAVLFPTYATLDDFAAQAARINGLGAPPAPKKFFARRDYSKFNSFFRDHNLNVRNVDQLCCSIREGLGEPRVFLMNYQSARGLSFKNVFVPFLAKETVIANHDLGLEAKLLFLACTRAGGRLRLSRAGHEPHYLTEIMPADCYVERRIPAPR
jgi:superfamily I DNA/RNA helicase